VSVWLERLAIAIASLALSVGLIAVLSGFFAGQDQAGVSGSTSNVGQQFADLGHVHLPPGSLHPAYDSDPPTSGAHVPVPVTADQAALTDDQLLQALEVGDVVIMYGGHRPPPGLRQFASAAGGFTPALAAAGQAVILARRPGTIGLIGLAWTRMVRVSAPSDPLLKQFVQIWLGRGAPGR
jgi:Protein of unknown function (DUF3105)